MILLAHPLLETQSRAQGVARVHRPMFSKFRRVSRYTPQFRAKPTKRGSHRGSKGVSQLKLPSGGNRATWGQSDPLRGVLRKGGFCRHVGCSEKEFQKRSFRWYVPCVPRYVPFCLRKRKGTPQGTSRKNAFSERSKRSEKERDERSLDGVPGPCSQVRPFLLAELKRDTPGNFYMNRVHA